MVISVALLGFFNSMGTDGSFGNEDAEQSVLAAIGKTITPIFEPMGIERDNWPATVALFTGLFAKEAVVGTMSSLYAQTDAVWGDGEEGAPIPMERVTLGQVLHRSNDRLIYVFDAFGERVMFLELMGSFKQPDGGEYPRTAFSQGDPPPQFDLALGVSDNDTDLFEEAMDDYYDFAGEESDDDD